MSRDLTPKELDMLQKTYNMPNLVDTMMIKLSNQPDEEAKPLYSDEQKELAHKYPRLGMFGFDFLNHCREQGILSKEKGQEIIQTIEDYFNGKTIEDKELQEKTILWYEGNFCPGYYQDDNTIEFAFYIKELVNGNET